MLEQDDIMVRKSNGLTVKVKRVDCFMVECEILSSPDDLTGIIFLSRRFLMKNFTKKEKKHGRTKRSIHDKSKKVPAVRKIADQ